MKQSAEEEPQRTAHIPWLVLCVLLLYLRSLSPVPTASFSAHPTTPHHTTGPERISSAVQRSAAQNERARTVEMEGEGAGEGKVWGWTDHFSFHAVQQIIERLA